MKDRIRLVMESQHMTQQTFAQFIGISPAALSSIFNGHHKMTLLPPQRFSNLVNRCWILTTKTQMVRSIHPNMHLLVVLIVPNR